MTNSARERVARRSTLRMLAAMPASLAGIGSASAQAWPDKSLWIVVPYAPGGAVDIVARTLGNDLSKQLGQQVMVDNRPGAGGNVGSAHVARSRPDGYTLLIAGGANTVARRAFSNLQYDPARDLAAIALIGAAPSVLLVSPTLPVTDVAGLVALARARPGALALGHGGVGTTSEHLAGEMFKQQAGIEMTTVAYKGGAAAITDLIGGQIAAVFTNLLNALPHLRSGKLKALAVASAQRVPAIADVPTMIESGFADFDVAVWWGLMGPAGMPAEVVARLNREVATALAGGGIRERLLSLSATPTPMTPEQFAAFYGRESEKWEAVAQRSGLKPE